MRSGSRGFAAVVSVGLALSGACASNTSPAGFLPTPEAAGRWVHGGWLDIELAQTDTSIQSVRLYGELLAVSPDSLWFDAARLPHGFVVPRRLLRGNLTRYDWSASQGALTGYTVLGVFSTISNGFFFLITAPAWTITASVAGAIDSHGAQTKVAARDSVAESELRSFSRFPLGIPPGYDSLFVRLPCIGPAWPCFPNAQAIKQPER